MVIAGFLPSTVSLELLAVVFSPSLFSEPVPRVHGIDEAARSVGPVESENKKFRCLLLTSVWDPWIDLSKKSRDLGFRAFVFLS